MTKRKPTMRPAGAPKPVPTLTPQALKVLKAPKRIPLERAELLSR